MTFKECIKNARVKAGLTQEDAANALGVSAQTIANWETERAKPDLSFYNKLGELYNIDVSELLDAISYELHLESEKTPSEKREISPTTMHLFSINHDKLKNFEFNQLEQEIFIILATYSEFGSSPIDKLLSLTNNTMTLCLILDKFRFYNLYHSKFTPPQEKSISCGERLYCEEFKLSIQGKEVFKIIKQNRYKLFSLYSLSEINLFNIFLVYNIMNESTAKTVLNIINSLSNNLILETYTYSESNNTWYKKVLTSNNSWFIYDHSYSMHPHTGRITSYEEIINRYLRKDLFKIIESELTDELYTIEKDTYLKKLNLYNQNKSTSTNIAEPKKFNSLFIKKLVFTEKGIKFMEKIIPTQSTNS